MPYARRDKEGRIVELTREPSEEGATPIALSDPEVREFLVNGDESAGRFLDDTDSELARVVEDLIALLIDKRLIMLTDLPEAAQRKLAERRRARDHLQGDRQFIVDEGGIL